MTASLIGASCAGTAPDAPPADTSGEPLRTSCVLERRDVPAMGWICGEARTVECTGPATRVGGRIYVVTNGTPGMTRCDRRHLVVNDPGPFTVGDHTIAVRDTTGSSAPICESQLHVVDRTPPAGNSHALELWPPNHKLHTFGIGDCVTVEDACDPNPQVSFTYAASTEAVDVRGSGHTDPDIILGCDQVQIRAERGGPGQGRVYTLGWRAIDASGNRSEGTCTVSVPHDQSGRPAAPGAEAYRIEATDCIAGMR